MMFFMSIMLVSLMTQVSTFAQEEAESTTSMRMNNGTGTMEDLLPFRDKWGHSF